MSEVLEAFTDAFSEAASKTAGAFLEETVKERLKQFSYSALFVTASSEVAKGMAEVIVGPMLKAFLKVLDPTQKKLDTILNEPLQTAVTLTRQCLSVQIVNENDRRICDQQFYAALQIFEKAYSYASGRKGYETIRIHIRLAQATIAKSMDAPGTVLVYLKEFVSTLKEQVQLAEAEVRRASEDLEEARDRQTHKGAQKAALRRDEMLAELGPQPRAGFHSASPLGMELGVDEKSWRYA